jgi:anti-sigma B factor antagonist
VACGVHFDSGMHFETKQEDGILVVVPLEKRLDAHVAPAFRAQLLERIDEGARHLVIDLAKVEFMDSSGLGALVSALKRLGRDGDLRVSSLTPAVRSMFELTRLNRVIKIVEPSA